MKVEKFSSEKIFLIFPHLEIHVENPKASLVLRLNRLMKYGTENLFDDESLPELYFLLEHLKKSSLLSYTVLDRESPILTLTPFYNRPFEFEEKTIDPDHKLSISRFAYIHQMEIKSPLLNGSLAIKNPKAVEFFYALTNSKSINELVTEFSELSKKTVNNLVSLLYSADLLSNADETPSLQTWEFHDLLFHTKSRRRHEGLSGGTYRFLEKLPPMQAIKKTTGDLIPLFKPDLEHLMKNDPPFAKVQEQRTSIRVPKNESITLDQLGEFLYRVARLKSIRDNGKYEATQRPYPGGGACYELELYPLIHNCKGLERGVYRYAPEAHALEIRHAYNEELLKMARDAMGKEELPQILILIAARFRRVSWKYEAIAYSVILKNTGALIQTMYLAATAMNLSPCAVGSGDSDLFAQLAKTDYYDETTVGEFVLGA